MDHRILDLIATVMDACAGPPGRRRRGAPPAEMIRVLTTLRQFLREGRLWRGLRATPEQASGSTLHRRLQEWAQAVNLLQQARAVLVAMLRGGDPDLILDSGSVRAERGGDLTGPNSTDRGKRGTKYRVAVSGEGVPVACAATAANVNDTLLFECLFLTALAVLARIRTVLADKGYDAEPHREFCRAFGAEPRLHRRGRPPHGSGLGKRRWPVERSHAWLLENRRLALRYDRLGVIVRSLLQAACLFLVANRLAREL